MRLLKIQKAGGVRLVTFDSRLPDYAILSHTWSADACDEVSIEDIENDTGQQKPAYRKLAFCIERCRAERLRYFWIDTCCINKADNSELSEAIRSMYKWYSEAKKCFVLLSDVNASPDQTTLPLSFRNSRWFTRGWTLQELIAPRSVELFSVEGVRLGTKHTLVDVIQEITTIPAKAITNRNLSDYSHEERFRWQSNRQTSKTEDIVYSMLGMFDIHIPILYGEGEKKARERLQRKLNKLGSMFKTASQVATTALTAAAKNATCNTHHFLPFDRDPNYVEPVEFSRAQEVLSRPRSNLVVVGLGGVGKSQLAIEYCYDLKDRQPRTWVLWLPSSTPARFDLAIRSLVNELNIPGREEDTADVFQLMYKWLKESQRDWLVVLDSLDNADFLLELPEQDQDRPTPRRNSQTLRTRWSYIPFGSKGKVLITTRDRNVAYKLGFRKNNIIMMSPYHSLAEKLVEVRLGDLTDSLATRELAQRLNYIPLAIVQATAYIVNSQGRCLPRDYIGRLAQGDDMMAQILGEHADLHSLDFRRDILDATNSILKTLQMSFEQIWKTNKSAACLLALMSFYNNQQIPEWLLKAESTPRNEHMERDFRENLRKVFSKHTYMRQRSSHNQRNIDENFITYSTGTFEDDVRVLRDYSLIEMIRDGDSFHFQMHRLVQLAAQLWLKSKGEQHQWWQAQSLRKLAAAFYGHGAYERWNKCRTLYPHARLAYDFKAEDQESQHAQASVLYAAAWFANEKGAYLEAEDMIRKSKQIFITCRSKTHRDTLAAMCELAWTMWNQQRWKDTEDIQRSVLTIRQRKLGRQHPATLLSMSKLALTLRHTGKPEEASRLEQQFRGMQSWLSPSISRRNNTLSKINSLEVQFWGQGQWNEAEELQSGALKTCRAVLGDDHRDTLMVASHLAATYLGKGLFDDARKLLTRCVEKQAQILGAGHPQTKDSESWLNDVEKQIQKRLQLMDDSTSSSISITGKSLDGLP